MRKRPGFTLIELILVVSILFILVAVTIPAYVNSIKGNRLRTAARMVVRSGRYARSMAVMKQRRMELVFDLSANLVSVRPGENNKRPFENGMLMDTGRTLDDTRNSFGAGFSEDSISGITGTARRLNSPGGPEAVAVSGELDDVKIEYVEMDNGAQRIMDGICAVSYGANGRCRPYQVLISDDDGNRRRIAVDSLAGAMVTDE